MYTPGPMELVIIMVIVLLVFGPGKLAGVGKSLGTAISEFKDAVTEPKKEDDSESNGETE
jgi:sec-independent protein translocase protein TatA